MNKVNQTKRVSTRSKAHHYLPQFYLRRFGFMRKKNKFRIWAYDKQTDKTNSPDTHNVCQETRLHEITDADGNVVSIEDWLTQMEGRLRPAYEEVCQSPTIDTLRANQPHFATLVAFLMLRSVRARNTIMNFMESFNRANIEAGLQPLQLPHLTEDSLKYGHFYELMQPLLAEVTNLLLRKKWVLAKNITSIPFLTSDYPFAISHRAQGHLWPIDETGLPHDALLLATSQSRLYFPLTPRLLLLICDPVYDADLPSLIHPMPVTVTDFNFGQVLHSMRFIFSSNQDFSFVQRVLKENPSFRKPQAEQFQVVMKWEPSTK